MGSFVVGSEEAEFKVYGNNKLVIKFEVTYQLVAISLAHYHDLSLCQ